MSRGTEVRQRTEQVGVRLLPEELAQVRKLASDEGVSVAEMLRRAPAELAKARAALARVAWLRDDRRAEGALWVRRADLEEALAGGPVLPVSDAEKAQIELGRPYLAALADTPAPSPTEAAVTIHQCPPTGAGVLPCCGRTPFEVPLERMTTRPALVTCEGP